MDIVRCVLFSLLLWLALVLGWFFLIPQFVSPSQLQTIRGEFLLVQLPQFFIYMATAGLAALIHTAPRRYSKRRHAVAVLSTPCLAIVVNIGTSLLPGGVNYSASPILLALLTAFLGVFAGWWLGDKIRGTHGEVINPYSK